MTEKIKRQTPPTVTVRSVLDRIEKPIRFALTGTPEKVSHIQGLPEFVDEQLSLLARVISADRTGEWKALRDQFAGFGALAGADRMKRLEDAVRILERIGRIMDGPGKKTQESKAGHRGRKPESPEKDLKWNTPVQYLKGVGPHRAGRLGKIGVETAEDLFYYIPWRYDDRSRIVSVGEIQPGTEPTLVGVVQSTHLHVTKRRGFKIFEALVGDETGSITVKWFNQPYLEKVIKKGSRLMVSGKVKASRYRGYTMEMENPVYEKIGDEETPAGIHTGRVVPVYHERAGWTSRQLRTLIRTALDSGLPRLPDFLPGDIRSAHGLQSLPGAVESIHFPPSDSSLAALNEGRSEAHRRLVFDEFLLLQLGLGLKRGEVAEETGGTVFKTNGKLAERFLKALPFSLTGGQSRVLDEIKRDMERPRPMNRLLQGDVGCGKTVVATAALVIAADNKFQSALMAPTEILAEQHYLNLRSWLSPLGLRCEILTGGRPKARNREIVRKVERGEVDVVVGTHALIQGEVQFSRLGMVVVDEQHKFGVLQRAILREKGYHPDVLVMTATPIPRTLALTVHGDLDLSVIREMPGGRSGIETIYFRDSGRARAYGLVAREVSRGRQAYVVYPLVEESEKLELRSAVEMAGRFDREVFPSLRVGLLHGQMTSGEKEQVMAEFKAGKIQILVSTTVIEVGIDVPNATMMVVEHAERFGLSQLHQLRGRVGRGPEPSKCILISGKAVSEDGRRRLGVMVSQSDGFAIAEEDLAIRGPGEFFGTRQSGLPELKVANLIRDGVLLETAREEALKILKGDPHLTARDHAGLREALERKWGDRLELFKVS